MKKKILKIVRAFVIIFVACNIIWFAWSHIKYGKFSSGMQEGDFSNFIEKTGRTPPTSKVGDECHFFKCEK